MFHRRESAGELRQGEEARDIAFDDGRTKLMDQIAQRGLPFIPAHHNQTCLG
jgi:hypothetical protein